MIAVRCVVAITSAVFLGLALLWLVPLGWDRASLAAIEFAYFDGDLENRSTANRLDMYARLDREVSVDPAVPTALAELKTSPLRVPLVPFRFHLQRQHRAQLEMWKSAVADEAVAPRVPPSEDTQIHSGTMQLACLRMLATLDSIEAWRETVSDVRHYVCATSGQGAITGSLITVALCDYLTTCMIAHLARVEAASADAHHLSQLDRELALLCGRRCAGRAVAMNDIEIAHGPPPAHPSRLLGLIS